MSLIIFTSLPPKSNLYPQFHQIWPKNGVTLDRYLDHTPISVASNGIILGHWHYEVYAAEGEDKPTDFISCPDRNELTLAELEVALQKLIRAGTIPSKKMIRLFKYQQGVPVRVDNEGK